MRSLENWHFLNLQGSDVVVEEKSVSVILLAGGKGKRMGVSAMIGRKK